MRVVERRDQGIAVLRNQVVRQSLTFCGFWVVANHASGIALGAFTLHPRGVIGHDYGCFNPEEMPRQGYGLSMIAGGVCNDAAGSSLGRQSIHCIPGSPKLERINALKIFAL